MERIESAEGGVVWCGHRKVAIVGAGPSRAAAPWDDDGWCWWALNEIAQPRFDRHFELHPMRVQSERDFAWLAGCPVPCYVLDLAEAAPLVRNAVAYPLDGVLKQTGGRRYFTCTFAYQIALAVAEGFGEIGLFGVDLDGGTAREQVVELPCVEYWVGIAEGRGVRVTLPKSSRLLGGGPLYGYDYDEEVRGADRRVERVALAFSAASWVAVLRKLGAGRGAALDAAAAGLAAELERADSGKRFPAEVDPAGSPPAARRLD